MCGISGIINFNLKPVDELSIRIMMKCIKHRGPNDEGIFLDQNVGLGFVRLSILDLSILGHQPMFDDTGRYVILHNGEVYNFIEIREELKSAGFKFNSRTDTEVILKSYIHWGEKCLDKFNGMWAFVIYDKFTKELFCARDRYGVKPFYYYLDKDRFIFASEILPILKVLKSKPIPNFDVIYDYLVFNRTDQSKDTFFEEIKKLQHGHVLKVRLAGKNLNSRYVVELKKWYDLRVRVENSKGFYNSDEFRELLSSAIRLRLRSDVPIGVCLSGGLDSSSIVSILLKDFNLSEVKTFSAVYGKGVEGDESEFINEFKSLVKNMYFVSPSADMLQKDLERFIIAHGEPIPSTSPYAQYKVMELAKDHVVVILDGQGADELLAGYHYFYGFFFKELLSNLHLLRLLKENFYYYYNHKSFYGLKSFLYFLIPQKYREILIVNKKNYLTRDLINQCQTSIISNKLYGSKTLNEALLNHFEYKLEHLLKWEDRNSMYFSLEARIPFLDYRLVEKMLATSSENIIQSGITKYILRDALKGTLPEKIRTRRDKIGFETPEAEWFREPTFQKIVDDLLNSEQMKNRKIIDTNKAKKLYKQHLAGKKDISKEIWKWINLELWFRKFID